MGTICAHERGEDSSSDYLVVLNDSSKYSRHFLPEIFFFKRKDSHNAKYAGANFPSRESEGESICSYKLFSRVLRTLFIRNIIPNSIIHEIREVAGLIFPTVEAEGENRLHPDSKLIFKAY